MTGSNLVARAARLTATVNVPIPLISGIGAADRIAASDDVCRNAKGHPRSRSEPVLRLAQVEALRTMAQRGIRIIATV